MSKDCGEHRHWHQTGSLIIIHFNADLLGFLPHHVPRKLPKRENICWHLNGSSVPGVKTHIGQTSVATKRKSCLLNITETQRRLVHRRN